MHQLLLDEKPHAQGTQVGSWLQDGPFSANFFDKKASLCRYTFRDKWLLAQVGPTLSQAANPIAGHATRSGDMHRLHCTMSPWRAKQSQWLLNYGPLTMHAGVPVPKSMRIRQHPPGLDRWCSSRALKQRLSVVALCSIP